jgi:hypothetical protein
MLDEATVEEVAACFHAPLLAAANMCRAFIQDMKSKGAGTFIQVQSPGAVTSWGGPHILKSQHYSSFVQRIY